MFLKVLEVGIQERSEAPSKQAFEVVTLLQ